MLEKNIVIIGARKYDYINFNGENVVGTKLYYYFDESDNENIIGKEVKVEKFNDHQIYEELQEHTIDENEFVKAIAVFGIDYATEKVKLMKIKFN